MHAIGKAEYPGTGNIIETAFLVREQFSTRIFCQTPPFQATLQAHLKNAYRKPNEPRRRGRYLDPALVVEDESLLSSPTRRKAPPPLFKNNDVENEKVLIDLSAVALQEARGASNKALEKLLQAKPKPGDVKAWIKNLETNETERAVLERSLLSFGSIENLANDQRHLDRENKKPLSRAAFCP